MEQTLSLLFSNWFVVKDNQWLIVTVSWVLCVMGWLGVASIPNQYESQAQIYVDTTTLLGPLLKGIAVQADMNQQLLVMKSTLLARPNIELVIRKNDMDLRVESDEDMEKLVDSIIERASISTKGANLYKLNFSDQSPLLASKVTKSLLDIFVSTNLGENRSSMENAKGFLAKQIAIYEHQLRISEKKLSDMKSRNPDLLGADNFYKRFDEARSNYQEIGQLLEGKKIVLAQLNKQLAATAQYVEVENSFLTSRVSENQPSNLELEIIGLSGLLQELKSKYTDSHPDVVQVSRKLEIAKSMLEIEQENAIPEPTNKNISRQPNTIYETLKMDVFAVEQEIVLLAHQHERATDVYDKLAALKETQPAIEAALTNLNRDYFIIKEQYEQLLERRESASLSAAREASADSVQFRIIEPPLIPTIPIAPKRVILNIIVLFMAVGFAVSLPIILAIASGKIYSSHNLEEYFDVPIIGTIDQLKIDPKPIATFSRRFVIWSLLGLLVVLLCAVVVISPNPEMLQELAEEYHLKYYMERMTRELNIVFR